MQPEVQSSSDRRVAFILPHLGFGGAERLTVDLVEELLARGFAVDVVLLQRRGEFLAQLPPRARVIDLAAKRGRDAILPLRRYLKRERPDSACAAIWSLTVIALIASFGLRSRTRMVVAEHCPLVEQYRDSFWLSLLLRITTRACFRLAHGIVGTSDGVSDELARLAHLKRSRVTTIYNPVKPPPCSDSSPESLWGNRIGKRVLAVGKLKKEKNFPFLISTFAELIAGREAILAIVGEGNERARLETAIRDHGLESRVLLPGLSLTPGDWYKGADLFVLSSDYEGFGIVLVEAMHFGLPVVSTDCPYGPAEILGHGKWGKLTPLGDAPAFARAMANALDEPGNPALQRRRAAEFDIDAAASAYTRLLLGDIKSTS